MTPERISHSTRIVHGLVLCSYPARAITLLPSRRLAAYIIAMSVEPRKIGPDAAVLALNCAKLYFEQGQLASLARASNVLCMLDATDAQATHAVGVFSNGRQIWLARVFKFCTMAAGGTDRMPRKLPLI